MSVTLTRGPKNVMTGRKGRLYNVSNLAAQPDAPSDAELISRVRAGDQAAYGELFERHREAAQRMARQLVRGPDIDDLISEAFTKVFVQLQRGSGPDVAFRAYLLTAIRRLHVDKARAAQRVQVTDDLDELDQDVDFDDPAMATFERGAASRAFSSLPERWQLVLWHLEVEEQKPADIAPLLGMSPNSVAALAYRAREGLRQAYLQSHLADTAADSCRWTTEHLGAYVRKGLAKRDSAKVESHLSECHRCTAVYLELTEVNSNLSGLLAPALLGLAAPGYLAAGGVKLGALLLWPWTKLKEAGTGAQSGAAAAAVTAVVAVAAVAGVFGGGDDSQQADAPSSQSPPDSSNSAPDNSAPDNSDNSSPKNQPDNQQNPSQPPEDSPPPDDPQESPPPDEPDRPPQTVPDAPAQFSGDVNGSNVVLSWSPVPDARGYRVYRTGTPTAASAAVPLASPPEPMATPVSYVPAGATPAAAPGGLVSDGTIKQTTFRDRSLVDGNRYRYVVTAVGKDEESQVSRPVTVVYDPSPDSPRALQAKVRDDRIELSWRASSEPDLRGYRVYRDGDPVGGVVRRPRLVDDDLTDGETYAYTVAAVDRGGQESATSKAADATYDPAPEAPRDLSASERAGEVMLRWDTPGDPDVRGYRIYRDGEPIGTTIKPRFSDSDAIDGGATYTVTAIDESDQESDPSDSVSADPAPARPSGVKATEARRGIDVEWNANGEKDLAGYVVLRDGEPITKMRTGTSYSDTDVKDGQTYRYRVVAVDEADNESGPSRRATASYDPVPDPPTGLELRVRANNVTLTWRSDEPDVHRYRVYADGEVVATVKRAKFTARDVTVNTEYTVTAVDDSEQESDPSAPATADVRPAAPTGLTAIETEGGVRLDWDPNGEADLAGYVVLRDGDPLPDTGTIGATTYTDRKAVEGKTHEYRVVAVDEADNESPPSESASAKWETPELPDLTWLEVEGGVELNWDRADADVAAYVVFRGGVRIDQTETTEYVDNDGADGKTYPYEVIAVDDAGNKSESSTVRGGWKSPRAPSDLETTPDGDEITLTWNAVPGASEYIVLRGGSAITDEPIGRTRFSDIDVTEDVTYQYSVVAVDEATNRSERSDPVPGVVDTSPEKPTGLTCTQQGSSLHFSWDPNSDPDFSHFEARLDGDRLGNDLTTPRVTDGGHTGDTEHTLSVTAVDTDNNRSEASRTFHHGFSGNDEGCHPVPAIE